MFVTCIKVIFGKQRVIYALHHAFEPLERWDTEGIDNA